MKTIKTTIGLIFILFGCFVIFFLSNNMEEISKKSKVRANTTGFQDITGLQSIDLTKKNNGIRFWSHYVDNDPGHPPAHWETFRNNMSQTIPVDGGEKFHVRGVIRIEKNDQYNGPADHAGWISFDKFIWYTPSSEAGTTVIIDEVVTIDPKVSNENRWFKFGYGGGAEAFELITSFSDLSLVRLSNQEEVLQNTEFTTGFNDKTKQYYFNSWYHYYVYNIIEDGWFKTLFPGIAQQESAQGDYIEIEGGAVTYRYRDKEDNELAKDKKVVKNIFTTHTEDPMSIEGYNHIGIKGDNPITIKKDEQTVTFVYEKDKVIEKGKVTIKYQDEKGATLAEEKVIEGDISSEYDTSDQKLALEGYEYSHSMGDPIKGTYKSNPQTVTHIYSKLGKLTVKYLDGAGKSIADDKVSYGKIKDSYTVTNIVIEGYRYNGDSNITGAYKETEQVVRLIYDELGTVTFKYQDEQGIELLKEDVYQDVVGEMYPTNKLMTISGYKYSKTTEDGNPSNYGEVTSEPKIVIYIYEENYFELHQKVNKLDGTSANVVALDEELIYSLDLSSQLKGNKTYYINLTMTEVVDSSLENPTDITLKTSDGSIVGKTTYNSVNRKITASIKQTDNILYSEDLVLSYRAKVKSSLSMGTLIKAKGNAKALYTDGKIASEKESNEVESKVDKGNLIFESAPEIISFGDDTKISSKKGKYYIESKDAELSVKDLRGNGSTWSMTAKMTKLLTHENKTTLSEGIRYPYNGNDQLMGLESEALIYEETTSSTDTISISNVWKDKITQPFVEVTPGIARKGTYSGVIQWTLRDVPSGHKLSVKGGIINE